MTLERFERLLDEVGDTLLTVRLWHHGEPLLNPDLPRMVTAAKRRGVFVAVSTNGSLLDAEVSRDLIAAGLDYLIVSFDGSTRETYELLHGADAFEGVLRQLREFIAIRREMRTRRPLFEFQTVVSRPNEDQINDLRRIAREVGADKVSFIRLDPGDVSPERGQVVGGLEPRNERYRLTPPDDSERCRLPWRESLVRYSGTVLPCVCDVGQQHSMGRLFDRATVAGFAQLWNGPAYREFRRRCARNAIPLCVGCTQRNNNDRDRIDV